MSESYQYERLYSPSEKEKNAFLGKTYGWMAVAMLLSAFCAFFTASSPYILMLIWGHNAIGFYVLAAAELILVVSLSMLIRKLPIGAVIAFFLLYSAINGVTLSSIFIIYNISSIAYAFLGSALMFGAMSIYGLVTKQNLARWGHYLLMALLGIIIVSAVNALVAFITRQPLEWINILISIATVVIFTGLTAYDTQKILRTAQRADGSEAYQKLAVYGALELYLDFINIFLSLLRLFGRRR